MEVRSSSGKEPRVLRLPGDLVVEILARVPYRSLCRFKLVSRSWRALCSDPAVRRRCPQTLSGFFFRTMPLATPSRYDRHFVNASGRGAPMVDPSFSFLPAGHRDACIIDPCNGLLLCERVGTRPHFGSRYFVCNPATEEWIDLPDTEATASFPTVRLGFDPAVSSHFRVFVLVDAKATFELHLAGIEIYSSENGAWTYRQTEWGDGTVAGWNSVFFKGTLHLTSPDSSSLLTVDIDANKWGEIPTPRDFHFIGVSQGQLHAVHISNRCNNHNRNNRLSIWVLEDYAGQQWTLKHEVDAMQMFGRLPGSFGDFYHLKVHAIHPEHGLIFLTAGKLRSLMSYNMDEKKVRFIWILGERNVSACPYVPCFSDWLPPGH